MAPKLKPEEIVTLKVLKEKGQSNVQIAQALGVSEGAVRYHVRRAGQPDGRQNKPRTADAFAELINDWLAADLLREGAKLPDDVFAFQPSIERRHIETLATCAFIREHSTLLVQGPPGVGKTHLVVGLGVRAIEQGFSVAFYRLEELLHEMRKDAAVSSQVLKRKKYFKVSYLVVNEVGFEPMSQTDASLFFRLVSYRYRRGSTAITTNKSVKDWPGLLAGDEALAAAILDRLLHKSVVLNVRGRSYRLQGLEKVLK
jgi:DNA replication protein DnaC